MHTIPVAQLFASPALRAAFSKAAAEVGDAFFVPVGPRRRPAATMALAPVRKPVLSGGVALVLEPA